MRIHEPLRAKWNYRAYIVGLRMAIIGCALVIAFGGVGVLGAPKAVVIAGFAIGYGAATVGVLSGMIGWAVTMAKQSVSTHHRAFIRMVIHDVFKGISG
jgi:hypothetical protein